MRSNTMIKRTTIPPAEPLAPLITETEPSTGVPGTESTNIDESTPPGAWETTTENS